MSKPKLSVDVVKAIREAKVAGVPQKEIAANLGVSAASVSRILNGSRHAPKVAPDGRA